MRIDLMARRIWMAGLAMTLTASVALAAEHAPRPAFPEEKNLCLLNGGSDCPGTKMSIIELIDGLKLELAKGGAVYSPDELKKLQAKLEEYEFYYTRIMYGNSR